jgi:cell division septation protein DedD
MKKMTVAVTIILLILLSECSKKAVLTGTVGSPINLVPELKNPEDTVACSFKWNFTAKPAESNMDVLSFQPDSRSFTVSFVPDVAGDYELQFTSQNAEGQEQFKQVFNYTVSPDTNPLPSADTGGFQTPPQDLSAPLPQYTQPETQTAPPVTYLTRPPVTQKPKPKAMVKGHTIPKVTGKYTIQISAWKQYNQAEAALAKLTAQDLEAYIQKAYFKETKETFYRIRTGTFDSYEEAKKVMKDLQVRFPKEEFWIDSVREDQ